MTQCCAIIIKSLSLRLKLGTFCPANNFFCTVYMYSKLLITIDDQLVEIGLFWFDLSFTMEGCLPVSARPGAGAPVLCYPSVNKTNSVFSNLSAPVVCYDIRCYCADKMSASVLCLSTATVAVKLKIQQKRYPELREGLTISLNSLWLLLDNSTASDHSGCKNKT